MIPEGLASVGSGIRTIMRTLRTRRIISGRDLTHISYFVIFPWKKFDRTLELSSKELIFLFSTKTMHHEKKYDYFHDFFTISKKNIGKRRNKRNEKDRRQGKLKKND